MQNRTLRFLVPALLVLATILAYYPAIRWAGFIWDDDVHLTKNPVIFAADGLFAIWSRTTWRVQFYPMTFTSFWLQYRLSGLNPLPYHLVNVLFHAANALLLWQLLRRMGIRSAFWVAAVFALHPLNVESVAWVAERKNVLMGFFILLAGLAYWRFEGGFENAAKARDWRFYALATAAFVAALFSKTVCCTFPAALAVIVWWKRGRLTVRDVLPLLPWLVFGLGLGWWTAHLEKAVVGSVGQPWNYTPWERALIAGRAVWFYIGKFLWPADLTFSYPLWNIRGASAASYGAPLGVAAALIALWLMRQRWGRGPLAALLFFLVTISPALGFVDYYTMIYSLVADHYVYLAMVGLAVLLLEPIVRMEWRRSRRQFFSGVLVILLIACGVLTWQRCFAYENQETLWRDTVQKNPESWLGRVSLGVELRRKGDVAGAAREFQDALAINPHCFEALNEMGVIFTDQGRIEEAEASFERAIQENPRGSTPYANLATLRVRQRRVGEAEQLYRTAVTLDPYNLEARLRFADLLAGEQRFDAAGAMFSEAIKLDPLSAIAHLDRGECLASLGKVSEALPEFEEAARLHPGWPVAENDIARARQFLAQPPR